MTYDKLHALISAIASLNLEQATTLIDCLQDNINSEQAIRFVLAHLNQNIATLLNHIQEDSYDFQKSSAH